MQRGSKELTHTLTESIARFEAEQKFIGDLLDNILPKSIASEIKQSSIASETMATKFERVTLMFALLCGVDGASENQEDVYVLLPTPMYCLTFVVFKPDCLHVCECHKQSRKFTLFQHSILTRYTFTFNFFKIIDDLCDEYENNIIPRPRVCVSKLMVLLMAKSTYFIIMERMTHASYVT